MQASVAKRSVYQILEIQVGTVFFGFPLHKTYQMNQKYECGVFLTKSRQVD